MGVVGVVWRNGDLRTLETRIGRIPGVALDAAEQIVGETVKEGAAMQRDLLDRATTRTGSERFGRGRGGSAGRNDTGKMIDAIDSTSSATSRRAEGSWGWLPPVEDAGKIAAQDFGSSRWNIPAAHSLVDSFITTREQFYRRVKRMVAK